MIGEWMAPEIVFERDNYRVVRRTKLQTGEPYHRFVLEERLEDEMRQPSWRLVETFTSGDSSPAHRLVAAILSSDSKPCVDDIGLLAKYMMHVFTVARDTYLNRIQTVVDEFAFTPEQRNELFAISREVQEILKNRGETNYRLNGRV